MNNLEDRVKQGRKAITLAKERGMNTSPWEEELARLEALARAQEVARRTRKLLAIQGWCLWRCTVFGGEVIAVVRDENVTGVPSRYPVYTEAELGELFQDDVSEATIRLVHKAKKLAGAKIVSGKEK